MLWGCQGVMVHLQEHADRGNQTVDDGVCCCRVVTRRSWSAYSLSSRVRVLNASPLHVAATKPQQPHRSDQLSFFGVPIQHQAPTPSICARHALPPDDHPTRNTCPPPSNGRDQRAKPSRPRPPSTRNRPASAPRRGTPGEGSRRRRGTTRRNTTQHTTYPPSICTSHSPAGHPPSKMSILGKFLYSASIPGNTRPA